MDLSELTIMLQLMCFAAPKNTKRRLLYLKTKFFKERNIECGVAFKNFDHAA